MEKNFASSDEDFTEPYLAKFKKDLSTIKIFQPRLRIINSALEAHSLGNYELSIPSLLTQIEGILWNISSSKGIVFGTLIITRTEKLMKSYSAYNLVKQSRMYDLMEATVADF